MYPILHNLEKEGIIESTEKVVEGKVRKYYTITGKGEKVLKDVKEKTIELFNEVFENQEGE